MAIQPISTLKGFFEDGDYPTGEQFSDLIDTLNNFSFGGVIQYNTAVDPERDTFYICKVEDVERTYSLAGSLVVEANEQAVILATFGSPIVYSKQTIKAASVSSQVDIFNVPGGYTWTKPDGAKLIWALCIGSGGGGGGGALADDGVGACGGASGAGGSLSIKIFPADLINSECIIVVGDGGDGGALVESTQGPGGNGSTGEDSEFDVYLSASAGQGGEGGKVEGEAVGGEPGAKYTEEQGAWGVSTGTDSYTGHPGGNGRQAAASGGTGGGVDDSNVPHDGGKGGDAKTVTSDQIDGGDGGTVSGEKKGSKGEGVPPNSWFGGPGGGGGAASITADGGDGAYGSEFGGGGGGGGGARTPASSGRGGKGGPGLVVIISYF